MVMVSQFRIIDAAIRYLNCAGEFYADLGSFDVTAVREICVCDPKSVELVLNAMTQKMKHASKDTSKRRHSRYFCF